MNRQQKIKREMENKILNAKIQKYVMAERQTIFVETILILMFVLKNEYNFGQKRTKKLIQRFLDNMCDFKLGYFTREMLEETIEKELKIDIEEFLKEEMAKTDERFRQQR